MKREEIKEIFSEATDEQLNAILKINGEDINKAKGKVTDLEKELKESKEAYESLKTEFDTLKENNASADEWKDKYDKLFADYEEKEKEAQRKIAEKAIEQRFVSVIGDREFNHEAIKADYLKKFSDEIAKKENAGRADSDIFETLVKDDMTAFKNITPQPLPKPSQDNGKDSSMAKARAIMGLPAEK